MRMMRSHYTENEKDLITVKVFRFIHDAFGGTHCARFFLDFYDRLTENMGGYMDS